MLGSSGGAWVTDLVNRGYVVMVENPANVAGATVRVLATGQPASVALLSQCDGGSYVIVDAYPAALVAAEAFKASGSEIPPMGVEPEPGDPCPPGMVGVQPYCISASSPWPEIPGLPPAPTPGGQVPGQTIPGGQTPAPQKSALPAWVLPTVIGVSVLAVGGAIVVSRRRGR
jgi:hypothetical protein